MTNDNDSLKYLTVTADDFGLSPAINKGIVESCTRGIVTSVALLVNAPATDEAIQMSQTLKNVQLGLHMSLVEGYCLSKSKGLTDSLRYFPGGPCLHRDWRQFTKNYLMFRFSLNEVENELELQLQKFISVFGVPTFVNSTQHLHLLPGIQNVFLKLCKKYKIKNIRSFQLHRKCLPSNQRKLQQCILNLLGQGFDIKAKKLNINTPETFLGFNEAGSLSEKDVLAILADMPPGRSELMVHPGYKDSRLIHNLPKSYGMFNWDTERQAMTSPKVSEYIRSHSIQLSGF